MNEKRIGEESVIAQLPASLRALLAWERFHLHNSARFQQATSGVGFDARYLPQRCGAFRLPCFWVFRKHLHVYGGQAKDHSELNLFEGSGSEERVLFPIHPASLSHYREFISRVGAVDVARDGACIWAVPTSSVRTLLVWPDGAPSRALFIKTSLHSPMCGDRRISSQKVGCSVGLSSLVDYSLAALPPSLRYLRESVGFVPRCLPNGGVIIRTIPKEVKEGRIFIAPLFALYGGQEERRQPLLLTMLAHHGINTMQFVEEEICGSIAKLWLKMSLHFGLILEAHGQDLLIALTPDLKSLQQFYYRDFEGLAVDWDLRTSLSLATPPRMPRDWSWFETYATWGYPQFQLASCKLRNSLEVHLHLLLGELEHEIRQWQSRGLLGGPVIAEGHLIRVFSRQITQAVNEMFGSRISASYDLRLALGRFVAVLMSLRKGIMRERRVKNDIEGDQIAAIWGNARDYKH